MYINKRKSNYACLSQVANLLQFKVTLWRKKIAFQLIKGFIYFLTFGDSDFFIRFFKIKLRL